MQRLLKKGLRTGRLMLVWVAMAALCFKPVMLVSAAEPTPPTPPPAPSAPAEPEPSSAPTPPAPPEPPSEPTSSNSEPNTSPSANEPTSTEGSSSQPSTSDSSSTDASSPATSQTSGPQANNNTQGSTTVRTGDSNAHGSVTTVGNSNGAAQSGGSVQDVQPSNSVVIGGNGAGSNNEASQTGSHTQGTQQNNQAKVDSGLNLNSNSGGASASGNVGDSAILSGDANTSGNLVTAVNTNIDGLAVAEFNVMHDHVGDIVLQFAPGCVNCTQGSPTSTQIANNGAGSSSSANTDITTQDRTFQNNTGDVTNELVLSADSGGNQANYNTGGDSVVKSGDANVAAQALTFLNNNLAGNVAVGVVNVFGKLIGDIILPEEAFVAIPSERGGSETTIAGNGTGSSNEAVTKTTSDDLKHQNNVAVIDNQFKLTADTGNNDASYNTGGDSVIKNGSANVQAQALNIVNSNIADGTYWLVLVNEAGKWVGKIIGQPEGQSFAGASNTEFNVSEDGTITAITGNGAGSHNEATTTQNTSSQLVQNNDAKLTNVLDLSAVTGNNQASYNTGGDAYIQSGDATIVANLVNFVNNNIAGNGKLMVAVVNVFGEWIGNFVPPGMKKEALTAEQQAAIAPPASITAQLPSTPTPAPQPTATQTPSGQGGAVAGMTTADWERYYREYWVAYQRQYQANYVSQTRNRTYSYSAQQTQPVGYVPPSLSLPWLMPLSPLAANTQVAPTPKEVKINLAWLLTILPFSPVALAFRRWMPWG